MNHKNNSNRKRKLIRIVLYCVLAIIALTIAYRIYFNVTDNLSFEDSSSSEIATFHFNRSTNQILLQLNGTSTPFLIDTGSACNSITPEQLEYFKSNGFEISESFLPVATNNIYGKVKFSFKVYYLSIPVKNSNGEVTTIKDIRFRLSRSNIFGQEFLKHFYAEVIDHKLYLHSEMPKGYTNKINLNKFNWAMSDWGGRYYWDLSLNNTEHRFFVDTGKYLDAIPLWLPAEEYNRNNLERDSISFSSGYFKDYKTACIYLTNQYSPYAVNPLGLDSFDWVIDLSNNALYFK